MPPLSSTTSAGATFHVESDTTNVRTQTSAPVADIFRTNGSCAAGSTVVWMSDCGPGSKSTVPPYHPAATMVPSGSTATAATVVALPPPSLATPLSVRVQL